MAAVNGVDLIRMPMRLFLSVIRSNLNEEEDKLFTERKPSGKDVFASPTAAISSFEKEFGL